MVEGATGHRQSEITRLGNAAQATLMEALIVRAALATTPPFCGFKSRVYKSKSRSLEDLKTTYT